jgi:hypothetical protein
VRRARRLAAAVALAVVTAACAGPKKPFELGLKEVPSDLLLGSQGGPRALPAQLPPTAFLVTDLVGVRPTPTSETLPPPLPEPTPPPLPSSCPEADPLTAVKRPITTDVVNPPVPAAYLYRTSGQLIDAQGGRNVPATAVHTVGNVQPIGPAEFTYDVTVRQGEDTTTTTYHVVPRTSPVVAPGLYISKVANRAALPFQPKPELLLLPFPALPGTTFNSAGSDGATSVEYDGAVDITERVDACGQPVDGIVVRLSNGKATTGRGDPGTAFVETFDATYVIATQYGGLSIRDDFKGGSPSGFAARELRGVINQVPQ